MFYITLVFGSPESFYAKFLVQTTAFIKKKKSLNWLSWSLDIVENVVQQKNSSKRNKEPNNLLTD